MCGLVGVAGSWLDKEDKNVFRDMLHFDVVRGEDSTGVASISKQYSAQNYEVDVYKAVGQPIDLYRKHPDVFKNKGVIEGFSHKVLMGHNRFRTVGDISTETAHPFDFPNVVGVHNGTIPMYNLKGFHGEDDKEVKTDSQLVYSELSEKGDIQKVWDGIGTGAAALVWWDKEYKTLEFLRNNKRPLFYTTDTLNKRLYWASEKWMLTLSLSRQGVKYFEPQMFEEDSHYVFDISKLKIEKEVYKLEKKKPVVIKKPTTSTTKGATIRDIFTKWESEEWFKVRLLSLGVDTQGVSYINSVVKGGDGRKVRIYYEHTDSENSDIEEFVTSLMKKGKLLWGKKTCTKVEGKFSTIGFEDLYLHKGGDKKSAEGETWYNPITKGDVGQQEFEEWIENCANCDKNILWEDRHNIDFILGNNVVCKDCSEDPYISAYLC